MIYIRAMELLLGFFIVRQPILSHIYDTYTNPRSHQTSQYQLPSSFLPLPKMQFFTTVMATLMLGGALLPTAFAAKYPCEIGNSRNRGESCSNEGWYGCSNNLKHTVSHLSRYLLFVLRVTIQLPLYTRYAIDNLTD